MARAFRYPGVSACAVVAVLLVSGCYSSPLKGGRVVFAGYKPPKVLVSYQTEGTVPSTAKYLLVEGERGEAILERDPDGSGTLFENRWSDAEGDHFSGWIASSHGYEFVVPADRTKPARKYVYPGGSYRIRSTNGIDRPVPEVKPDPVATLIPE